MLESDRAINKEDGNRSYRLRGSRITGPQALALEIYWSEYGIERSDSSLDYKNLFPEASKVILEIGFGMGEATALIARDTPDTGFIAVEVHRPGIGKLLSRAKELDLKNLRVIEGDIHPIMNSMIAGNSLDAIHLFFPDPWPKARHHKRRIVNANFLPLIHQKLKDGGYIHIATDWVPYAEHIMEIFAPSSLFSGGEVERPDWRPVTRFEGQGITKDHRVTDLRYYKK